jgi:hypothetical protein
MFPFLIIAGQSEIQFALPGGGYGRRSRLLESR